MSSLLAARLACPFRVHSGGRIAAREEANEKRLAAELLQTILNLSKKAFRDVVREYHLAIGLVGGHGGVTEKGGWKEWRNVRMEVDALDNWLRRTFPYAKDEKTVCLCHPKTSVPESAALIVVS